MKKIILLLSIVFTILSCCGCNRIVGSNIVEMFDMEFSSQIEMIEQCLSVDLDDLTDKSVKTIRSNTDPNGNDLTIKHIDLDGAGDYISNDITSSNNWNGFPIDEKIDTLLSTYGVDEYLDFALIDEGYFTVSGVSFGKEGFDFNINNFNNWYAYEIGIWDANAETLYYISITTQ